jgi:hypothetical protein
VAGVPAARATTIVGRRAPDRISNGASGARISDRTGRSAAAARAQTGTSAVSSDWPLNPSWIGTPERPTIALIRSARAGVAGPGALRQPGGGGARPGDTGGENDEHGRGKARPGLSLTPARSQVAGGRHRSQVAGGILMDTKGHTARQRLHHTALAKLLCPMPGSCASLFHRPALSRSK